MIKNCKSCIRHLFDEPVCKLPDGTQSEATEFEKELNCFYYFSVVDSLKVLCVNGKGDNIMLHSSTVKQIIVLLEEL